MGMLSINNYPGFTAPMVDKLIGDAFDVVKYVYDHMDDVQAVATAVTQSDIGEPLLMQRGILAEGSTGAAGATVTIDFPDLAMELDNILSSVVRIKGVSGALYFYDSGTFTAKVTTDGLVLTLSGTAPADVQNSLVQWFVIYGG